MRTIHIKPDDPLLYSSYDELPLWSAPFGLTMLSAIPYINVNHVLDIGCGCGFPAIEIAQRLGEPSQVIGIDHSEKALERALEKANYYGVKNIQMLKAEAENLPFENDYFDLLVSNNGLNNVNNDRQALAECYRVCKNGGQLISTMNLPESFSLFYSVFRETLDELGLKEEKFKIAEHIAAKRKTIEEWEFLFTEVGFKTSLIETQRFTMSFASGTALFNHSFMLIAFAGSWINIVGPINHEKVFNRIEEKLNKIAVSSNGIHLEVPYVCFTCKK